MTTRLTAHITMTMRNLLFKNGVEDWPGVSARTIHGGIAEFHWPPELTPKIIRFVDRIKPERQVQKIKTHELLQIRLFEQWKRWDAAGRP